MRHTRLLIVATIVVILGIAFTRMYLASSALRATPTLERPTPRPTFAFPTGTPVPITSAEGVLIETEPGPLYVIVSTVDEHGLKGQALIELASQPGLAEASAAGTIRSGTFAQVLEIRRLPPDYLRGFYRVSVDGVTGWVGDYLAHRTVFVIMFDERGCACPMPVPFWADAELTQPAAALANRSPLRVLALGGKSVQVQVLSDGSTGWLSRAVVFESQENEFLKYIAP